MAPAQVIETKDLPPELLDGQIPAMNGAGAMAVASVTSHIDGWSQSATAPASGGSLGLPVEGASSVDARVPEATVDSMVPVDLSAGHFASSVLGGSSIGAGVSGGASVPFGDAAVASASAVPAQPAGWLKDLEREARTRLEAGQSEVWDSLTRQFEASLIHTALELTRGRRIEAAQKLGIGRNTITRKIQELGIDD
jgi:two-component system nitrogen regulation response regulator GlnG